MVFFQVTTSDNFSKCLATVEHAFYIKSIILAATIGFLTIPYLTPIFQSYVMAAPHFKLPVSEM